MSESSNRTRKEKRDAARLAAAVALIESRGGKVVAAHTPIGDDLCSWCVFADKCVDPQRNHRPVDLCELYGRLPAILDTKPAPALPPRPADLSVLDGYELGDVLTDCREKRPEEYAVADDASCIFTGSLDRHPVYGRRRWIVQRNPRPTVAGWDFADFRPRANNCEPYWQTHGGFVTISGLDVTTSVWIAVRKPAPQPGPVTEHEALMALLRRLDWPEHAGYSSTADREICSRYLAEHGKAVTP